MGSDPMTGDTLCPVSQRDVTELLHAWTQGDRSALDALVPLVYPDLEHLARAYLRRGASPVTLQTTAVVNDLFVKLLAKPPRQVESRRHFYILAARMIRTGRRTMWVCVSASNVRSAASRRGWAAVNMSSRC